MEHSSYSRSQPQVVVPTNGVNSQRGYVHYTFAQTATPTRPVMHSNSVVSDNVSRRKHRIPSVEDALPFAPLTSIVPYSPDIIPYPSIAPSARPSLFTNQTERRHTRATLDQLNHDAAEPQKTCQRLSMTLRKLEQLLKPEDLTEYRFARPTPDLRNSEAIRALGETRKVVIPKLSPFSIAVMGKADISFRYPTPETPPHLSKHAADVTQNKRSENVAHEVRHVQPSNTKIKPTVHAPFNQIKVAEAVRVDNIDAFQHNAAASKPNSQGQSAGLAVPAGPAIYIPALSSSVQRTEYQSFPNVDRAVHEREKRKRDQEPRLNLNVDQRQKADATLQTLNTLLDEVFQAEDEMQRDTSGTSHADKSLYFVQTAYNDDDTHVFARGFQTRLEASVQKVVTAKCFDEVPLDKVLRVHKICESTISSIEALSLSLGDDVSDVEVEEWLRRIELAENGLQAARILLRTMTAGRDEKQMYSEDVLLSTLRSLERVISLCLVPVVESRKSSVGSKGAFEIYSKEKKTLSALLHMCGRVMRLLGDLILNVDVAETVVFKVESLSTRLIFVENAYSEKDSALGTQRFETVRRGAMDVLAKIFARHPRQRSSIFNEILSSLEKLPITRQSARQFKMPEGRPIQLVSALLMRLVQTSGARSVKAQRFRDTKPKDISESDEEDEETESDEGTSPVKKRAGASDLNVSDDLETKEAARDLRTIADPLPKSAWKDASYLINFLVQRALTSSKSGDTPYRHLLDIFTEDFLSVLGLPDWPAAELLLRLLLISMVSLMDDEKRSVPAKNLALDLMGIMGSGISDLRIFISHARKNLDSNTSEITANLLDMASDVEEGQECDMDCFQGPYRVVMEYLHSQGLTDPQTQSARGYLLGQWADRVLVTLKNEGETAVAAGLPLQLRNMLIDSDWLHNEYDAFESVLYSQARLAASLIVMTSPFGRAYPKILNCLLSNMASQQPTLRSRSMKSVTDLLGKDPSLLERNNTIINNIMRCTQDKSPSVRDSALMLLGKCLVLQPSLENKAYGRIISLSDDESVMVRKHAMKMMREIYSRNDNQEAQSAIAAGLMLRVKDLEDSVSDLARQTFEELWIAPFRHSPQDAVQSKLKLERQVALIAKTTQRGESAIAVLETLLQTVLSRESKFAEANFRVCKDMVAIMFDGLIDNETPSDRPSQVHIGDALTVFAKSEPKLFNSDQLRLLEPYLKNLNTTDNLPIYNSAVAIFTQVLPSLPSVEHEFLQAVCGILIVSINKITKNELPNTVACLWVIRNVLKSPERIVRVMKSVLLGASSHKDKDLSSPKDMTRVGRYIEIAGFFGKTCNFDDQADTFRATFPFWTGKLVAGLIVDLLFPFTRQNYPQALRETALESIARICQGWPQTYLRTDVSTAFDLVFLNQDSRLEQIVLTGFCMFFHAEEKRSDTGAEIKVGGGKDKGQERLSTSFVASDNDAGATTIAQKFLPHVLRIALESTDELALTATEVIASISRQGLVHPKECGPALVALETSTNKAIATVAFEEHRSVHTKHESMFEKEYMKAVHQAFKYQQDVLHDARGVTLQPVSPKLRPLFEVLKTGTSKVRKRFLANICARIDFDLLKLSAKGDMPQAMVFARFVLENLSFFEYARIDELLHLLSCLEKMVVQGTGTVVAHAIELEILKVQIEESNQHVLDPSQPELLQQPVPEKLLDPQRLRQLTAASIILSMVWETRTHLRHLWGLHKAARSAAKPATKDLNKAPTKTPFVSADKHLDKISAIMSSLLSADMQLAQCKAFAELLSVDNEVKITSENEDEEELARQAAGYETPDEDGADVTSNPGSSVRSKKRKGPAGVPNTPSTKKRKTSGTPKKSRGVGGNDVRKRSRAGSSASTGAGAAWD